MNWTATDLAKALEAERWGAGETVILGLADIETAEPGDLVFAENEKFLALALKSRASVVLTTPILAEAAKNANTEKVLFLLESPRTGFVKALELFAPKQMFPPGTVHPTAFLGENVTLGERVTIYPGVFVGNNCSIGNDTILYANVVLYSEVTVGQRCLLHAGCVIGGDGFGFIPVGRGLRKVPHLGTVEIGDEVEIGANSCIDRSKTGKTVIGTGTKIDNLVHVAHNVKIGQFCILVAQTGIAGSVTIGNGVTFAGQSGVVDHITIGDGATIGAKSGVTSNVSAGEIVFGFPARPRKTKLREWASISRLPDALKRIQELEKRLAKLEANEA